MFATIVHRVLTNLFAERGVRLDPTYQLNVGGKADFMNMLDRARNESTRISKTQSVMSQFDTPLAPQDVHVGSSDYVSWLKDRKWAYVRMEGTSFGNVPLNVELKLEVWDSPNAAGVVIDAVRCIKLALDRKIRRRARRALELFHELAARTIHRCARAPSSPAMGPRDVAPSAFHTTALILQAVGQAPRVGLSARSAVHMTPPIPDYRGA